MRIAIVSDIHGNLTALEAVLADLKQTAPDLVLHGGDLADAGASPAEIVDRIQQLGWSGVMGNTDEMLIRPESAVEYARQSPAMEPLLPLLQEMAAFSREQLGAARLQWLSNLPMMQRVEGIAVVHASPQSAWRAPGPDSTDEECRSVYEMIGTSTVIYGHIHQPFVRKMGELTVVNSGSVSLSYDGDPRASYALVEDGIATLRRVSYDVEREIGALTSCGFPRASWLAKILRSARPQLPG